MGTNWQSDTIAEVEPLELSDEPKRDAYWFDSVRAASDSGDSRLQLISQAQSTPIAALVSGGYWSRSAVNGISFNRAWLSNKTANIFRTAGLCCPAVALANSIDELRKLEIRTDAIIELIASACLPPKRVQLRWMSLGECLHRLLGFDLLQVSFSPVTVLSIDAANWRFLTRNGVTSIARLLFSHPDELLLLRGFGHIRFSKLVASLLLLGGASLQNGVVSNRWAKSAVPLADWFQLRVHQPPLQVTAAATEVLLEDCEEPFSTRQIVSSVGLLQLNEKTLSTQGVGPRGFLQAMSMLSDEYSFHSAA